MAGITLSANVRSNLLSLQGTAANISTTQGRLSTGLKVSSAVDDAVAYFQGKGLSDRASDFADKKDGIDQGISSVKTALGAIESVDKIVKQMKGLILSAKSSLGAEAGKLKTQFNELASQVNELVKDASYQGLNLLNSSQNKLTVNFSNSSTAKLEVKGVNIQVSKVVSTLVKASALGSTIIGNKAWSVVKASELGSTFDAAAKTLDSALTTLRGNAKTLGTNVALLQTRLDFTKSYVNTLTEGSGKMTLADLNEEGANLVSLQTRQQLSVQALQFAGQSEQSVLRLFG